MSEWLLIDSAPKDGRLILGRRSDPDRYTGILRYRRRRTWWGKTSHVSLYGWCFGKDPENIDLWEPTHWRGLLVKCVDCQTNYADPPGWLCPGCEAYREHQR